MTRGGIRPTADVELQGVDLPEMGVLAYPEFYGSNRGVGGDTAHGEAARAAVGASQES
jgi:hypothetical protein